MSGNVVELDGVSAVSNRAFHDWLYGYVVAEFVRNRAVHQKSHDFCYPYSQS